MASNALRTQNVFDHFAAGADVGLQRLGLPQIIDSRRRAAETNQGQADRERGQSCRIGGDGCLERLGCAGIIFKTQQ